jgi:xanthine dehydrogenase YagT iron-sulfur-binding subunit
MEKDVKRKRTPGGGRGVTRRGFLVGVGAGAVAAAASGSFRAVAAKQEGVVAAKDLHKVRLAINGRMHGLLVEPRWNLLFVLREKLGLTGTKVGCDRGECGACTVLIDDIPRYACMTLAMEAEGQAITTLEGLLQGESLGPVQQAFLEQDAFQCGYCTPGQIMAAEGLLRKAPSPGVDEIRRGVSGNLCRCGAYAHIFKAVEQAAGLKKNK